jgi:hypothetical protein
VVAACRPGDVVLALDGAGHPLAACRACSSSSTLVAGFTDIEVAAIRGAIAFARSNGEAIAPGHGSVLAEVLEKLRPGGAR